MDEIETTAKTTEEAIEIALLELDADRAEVEINVVSRGKAGILGLGSEPARVHVTRLKTQPDVVKVTTEVVTALLTRMNVSARINLLQAFREELAGPVFEIEGEDSGLLIGRRGETLRALQFLVKCIVSERLQEKANLMLDVEGYQQRRYDSAANLAQSIAARVVSSGRSITLEPMPPDERRIVHLSLSKHDLVATESTGAGTSRQVTIHLKNNEE